MSKKTKGKIFIFLWKLTMILSLIGIILTCITNDEQMQLIFFIASILLFIMMIAIGIIGEKYADFRKITTAEKYQIKINEYKDISYYFSNSDYERENIKIDEDIYGDIYYKIDKKWYNLLKKTITLMVTINMKEYDSKIKNIIMENIDDWLIEKFGDRNGNFDHLEVALVLCLDSINDKFKNYINKDIFQDYRIILLPIGIILDEKYMYVRVQKEAYLKANYKRLKKKFMETIDHMIVK